MIELKLPWPPSVNHYKTIGKTLTTAKGKTYQQRVNSPETKVYYYHVWMIVRRWIAEKRTEMPLPLTISLEVTIGLHPPDRRRRDVDNSLKVLLDSLVKAGLIEDDSQIARLVVERRSIIDQGQVIVTIKALSP